MALGSEWSVAVVLIDFSPSTCHKTSCSAQWLSAVQTMDFRSSCDCATGRAHGLRPVAGHPHLRGPHPVDPKQRYGGDQGDKSNKTNRTCVHGYLFNP